MRPLYLLAASALALSATACAPKAPTARATLDCPMRQGDLTRTSASADGKVCTYTGTKGTEVTLQLVSTPTGVDQALSAIETNLLADRVKPDETAGKDGDGKAAPKADPKSEANAAQAEADARGDAASGGVEMHADANGDVKVDGKFKVKGKDTDAVNVEMKGGKTVVTESDDGTTRVNLPGIHIEANDNDDSAQVSVGPIHIDAGGGRNTVRIRRDVRLRGEALNPERRGIRATFIYTGVDLPNGYHFVGYEAGGPKTGPITVAVVKSKAGDAEDNELYPDVKKLVRRNGGV
jgi:hypothetical protein